LVKDTNESIATKQDSITSKKGEKAQAETDKSDAEGELESTNTTLEQLANTKTALQDECDFLLKNFKIRQTSLDEEVEALRQAKSILSGADLS